MYNLLNTATSLNLSQLKSFFEKILKEKVSRKFRIQLKQRLENFSSQNLLQFTNEEKGKRNKKLIQVFLKKANFTL